MGSSTEANAELRTRVRQQEIVAELGQQALETDDLDRLMDDASIAVAAALDADFGAVLVHERRSRPVVNPPAARLRAERDPPGRARDHPRSHHAGTGGAERHRG